MVVVIIKTSGFPLYSENEGASFPAFSPTDFVQHGPVITVVHLSALVEMSASVLGSTLCDYKN